MMNEDARLKASQIRDDVVHAIGNTPLVHLRRLHPGPGRLLAKLEYLQPGSSIKDRAARAIIDRARRLQELAPGQPVVEMTSGNMGAGLAVVCAALGHPLTLVMSAGNSVERRWQLEGLGAEVITVDQVDGSPGRVTGNDIARAAKRARQIARQLGAYYVDQFNNPGSVEGHELGTGPEIWHQANGRLDAFVAAVGSGGTFVGTSRALKSRNPDVLCAAVEPTGAEVLAGRPVTRAQHRIQGVGYGLVPPHWDAGLADRLISVDDNEAVTMARLLGQREGLCVGPSSGANVVAALRLLADTGAGRDAVVVTVLPDSGLKYGRDLVVDDAAVAVSA